MQPQAAVACTYSMLMVQANQTVDSYTTLRTFTDGSRSYSFRTPLQMRRFIDAGLTHTAELIPAMSPLYCDASAAQTRLACSALEKYAGFLTQSMYVVEYLLAV